jgi:hypothetical protein
MKTTQLVKIFLIVQTIFLVYILILFAFNPVKLYLETPRAEFEPALRFAAKDIVDTCNVLYGDETSGIEENEGELRRNLKFDTGQSFWLVLKDNITDTTQLFSLARKAFSPKDYKLFKGDMEDGMLNFFYDLGAFRDVWASNLSVAVQELSASYMLPWQRKIDFALISNLNEQNTGGIYHLMLNKPFLPIIIPPTSQDDIRDLLGRPRNLLILPKGGRVAVSPRLSILVMPFMREGETQYEAVLLVKIKGGLAVICGVGEPGPKKILDAVKALTPDKLLYYIGGTNMLVGENAGWVWDELIAIHRKFPELRFMPNFNTSLQAQAICAEVFGSKSYSPAKLGSRIKLED